MLDHKTLEHFMEIFLNLVSKACFLKYMFLKKLKMVIFQNYNTLKLKDAKAGKLFTMMRKNEECCKK
jgi:hypothetical protein